MILADSYSEFLVIKAEPEISDTTHADPTVTMHWINLRNEQNKHIGMIVTNSELVKKLTS